MRHFIYQKRLCNFELLFSLLYFIANANTLMKAEKILKINLPKTHILTNEIHGAQKLIFANLVTFLEFYGKQNFFAMFRKTRSRS